MLQFNLNMYLCVSCKLLSALGDFNTGFETGPNKNKLLTIRPKTPSAPFVRLGREVITDYFNVCYNGSIWLWFVFKI